MNCSKDSYISKASRLSTTPKQVFRADVDEREGIGYDQALPATEQRVRESQGPSLRFVEVFSRLRAKKLG